MGSNGTKVREDGIKGEQRRTSGRVSVCASFKLSLCHCQDEACISGYVVVWSFCVCAQTCERRISPTLKPSGVFTFRLLSKYLKEIKKRGSKNHRERNRKKESERGTEKVLNLKLCCCWHLLKGFSVRQGARLTGSVLL